jgi:hypothetical protein
LETHFRALPTSSLFHTLLPHLSEVSRLSPANGKAQLGGYIAPNLPSHTHPFQPHAPLSTASLRIQYNHKEKKKKKEKE